MVSVHLSARLVLVSLLILMLTGCVTTREQSVDNQVYSCTHSPTLKAQIRDDLLYIGRVDSDDVRTSPDFAGGVTQEVIIFGQSDADNKLTKGLAFVSETMKDNATRFISKGCEMVDKNDYFHNGYFTEDFKKKCRLIGITNEHSLNTLLGNSPSRMKNKYFSGLYLFESQTMVVNGDQTLFEVLYLESIENKPGDYWETMDETMLSNNARKQYTRFLENVKTAYKELP